MIILIDTEEFIPKKCGECKRFFARMKGKANGEPVDAYINGCVALGKSVEDVSRRLPDCPIKYRPERMQPAQGSFQSLEEAYQGGLNDGWNSCIDSIERD